MIPTTKLGLFSAVGVFSCLFGAALLTQGMLIAGGLCVAFSYLCAAAFGYVTRGKLSREPSTDESAEPLEVDDTEIRELIRE